MILGKDYQTFLRKGAPEPQAVSAAPAPGPDRKAGTLKIPSTPLVKTNVLKASTRRSPLNGALDTFAADGVVSAPADELGASQIPELFRSVRAPALTPERKLREEAPKVPPQKTTSSANRWVQQMYIEAEKWAPRWACEARMQAQDWWTRERLGRVVEGSLPNRKMDILAIECAWLLFSAVFLPFLTSHLCVHMLREIALCAFTCASLNEDRYGVVQRDIPRILESFTSFLQAIEEYQAHLNATFASKYPSAAAPEEMAKLSKKEVVEVEREREEMVKAGEVLSEVGDGEYLSCPFAHVD